VNPHPNGHTIHGLHVLAPDLGDEAIDQRTRCRYQCAACGWAVVSDDPGTMRRLAREHHGIANVPVFRRIDEVPLPDFRQT